MSVGDHKSLHSPGTSSPGTSSSESEGPGGEYLVEEGGEENTNISNDGLDDDITSTTKTTKGTPKEKSVAQVNWKRVLQKPASAMPVSSAKKMSKTKMAENV
ncbi:hypothetical protein J6590_033246 [Homalodisca vitripennis]|nr:hypothetical protein J6590_033246 [Homalodisca vitripennis]